MMNATQLPFLVEAILLLAAGGLGLWLRRKPRPFGKVALSFHLFFYLWFTMGYFFIASTLWTTGVNVTWFAVALMGLAVLTQLGTGLFAWLSRQPKPAVGRLHFASASVLLGADLVALVASGWGL